MSSRRRIRHHDTLAPSRSSLSTYHAITSTTIASVPGLATIANPAIRQDRTHLPETPLATPGQRNALRASIDARYAHCALDLHNVAATIARPLRRRCAPLRAFHAPEMAAIARRFTVYTAGSLRGGDRKWSVEMAEREIPRCRQAISHIVLVGFSLSGRTTRKTLTIAHYRVDRR